MHPDHERLTAQISRIKEIMELASEHKLLPDWAAIVGGSLVLACSAGTWLITRSLDVRPVFFLDTATLTAVAAAWVAAAAASLILYYVIALREARRLGVSLESRPSRLAARALSPALLVAVVMSLRLLKDQTLGYLPGLCMLCYGVGVYNAGLFSTRAPRVLGILFMATGAASILAWPELDLLWTALSFGAYHVAFGWYVLAKKTA